MSFSTSGGVPPAVLSKVPRFAKTEAAQLQHQMFTARSDPLSISLDTIRLHATDIFRQPYDDTTS